ncbi:flavin reductase family protein [Cesiribacter sp. SM1]|uniref:flavin reductase family protein n=1 Tax=Cesiribacter sp. SM1 TaxID=2861196 RepID=UPI001CD53EBA|nr:flavin reductase [Cesiribacter sp. SM1]
MEHIIAADLPNLEQGYRRNLINSITGFKSVSLVGTINRSGITNLAVFSQIFHLGADPALIGVLVRPQTTPRHTLMNMEETGYFTINHIRQDFLYQAHHTSARWDHSEFHACRLTPWYSKGMKAPYVAEANIRIGLQLAETQTLAINKTVLVIGAIEEIWVPENCLGADGFVDLEEAGSLTCSGLDSYHSTKKVARLTYAKPANIPRLLKPQLSTEV